MANNRIAGVAYLKADGKTIDILGNWTSNLGIGGKREGIAGQDGVHGYKEMPTVPKLTGDGCYSRTASIEEIRNITDATVTLELANGAVHIYRNAWNSDEIEADSENAKFKLTFEAMQAEELRPGV